MKRLIYKIIFLVFLLATSALLAEYVAKIDKKKIGAKEFQSYINNQKFILNQSSYKSLVSELRTTPKEFLREYVGIWLLFSESQKKGYDVNKSKKVKDYYNDTKDDWLQDIYLKYNADISSLTGNPTDGDLEKIYNKYIEQVAQASPQNSAGAKKYKDLTSSQKQQLAQLPAIQQLYIATKIQEVKDDYRKKLEKKYKVKRFKKGKEIIAKVGQKNITQSLMDNKMRDELKKLGVEKNVDLKELKNSNQIDFEVIRNELILIELVKLEIKKTGFLEKKKTVDALKEYRKTIALELYRTELMETLVTISVEEIDEAFKVLKQQNPAIINQFPSYSEMENYLREYLKTQKSPVVLREYIQEKKDGSIIKYNYDALDSIL